MQQLIATSNRFEFSAALTPERRELIPLAFSGFVDAAATATARGTFYNTREEQEAAAQSAHKDLLELDRDIYSVSLLLPGVTDYSRQLGVRQLLGSKRTGGRLTADQEFRLLQRLVDDLPPQRMLKLFGQLRQTRINNARTRRLILTTVLPSRSIEFWSVKYRQKLRAALTHAWGRRMTSILRQVLRKGANDRTDKERGIVRQHVARYVDEEHLTKVEQCVRFILGDESDVTLQRLAAYRDAKRDFDRGSVLPTETMEGLRSRFHKDRKTAEVLELTKRQLTSGQRIAVQRKASEAGVKVAFDPQAYDAVRLYIFAFEMGLTEAIRAALIDEAKEAADRLPFRFERVAVLVDSSESMVGHATQARHPIATALALRDMLMSAADESEVLTSDGQVTDLAELVQPAGDTAMAEGLVRLLKKEPDAVFVLTDGYENAPAGRFGDVVEAARRMGVTTPIHQFSPVFAAESRGVRRLSETLPVLPVSKPDAIGLGLLKVLIESDLDRGIAALFGAARLE